MRKQTRPFAVEIKRAKGSARPSPFLGLVKEAPDPGPGRKPDLIAMPVSQTEPAGPSPRILEASTPGREPEQAAEIVRPRRGRPPKTRPEPQDETPASAVAAPVAKPKPKPRAAETAAVVGESEPSAQVVVEMQAHRAGGDEEATAPSAPRRSRRAVDGKLGERWKRHLPRWKR
ncbi:hypothetical protein [Jiella mangrovi]|uniref:Uncharacterized protein n=1 Tax=Jiella mangrovi TaxID=2821407 RepID=A0ABS4BNK4_9HYPH|nr:hypothetical protein [Jiella mangrovi]MBP0618317.1 hypothetical protein [Jiella mangrovi]